MKSITRMSVRETHDNQITSLINPSTENKLKKCVIQSKFKHCEKGENENTDP